ncbi:MAG: tRNA 4-thiouridine(8) synthase ThiI [Clostridia bacterium]|nr:tRNA 4-thiouridine(8) synthase ThiI [Clostridia bacterium]
MKEILLIKNGEIALKGLNRSTFEDTLIKNIKNALSGLGLIRIKKAQSTIYVSPVYDDYDMDEAVERVKKVFGIAAFSRAAVCEKDMDVILETAVEYLRDTMEFTKTFKVEAKRADKKFPLKSPEICKETGAKLLSNFHHLKVDVHNPEVTVTVEIRDFGAYIHIDQVPGAGGMPVGTGGKAAILISGGIDSPVAAYMLAKRGVKLTAIHFASPPYTSERAEIKVKDLLRQVAKYSGGINFCYVPFTKIQENIAKHCPEDLTTLIMRRYMMKIAERIAKAKDCDALITGESIGQVASQTMKALAVTDCAVNMPVFRPLIGMDKEEIVKISREIGTFEISTLPYEDCCTVFTPKHPRTRPNIPAVIRAEVFEGCDEMVEEAIENATFEMIY